MKYFTDKKGQSFVLYDDVLKHILSGHPEIAEYINLVGSTLKEPDFIYRSRIYENRFLILSFLSQGFVFGSGS